MNPSDYPERMLKVLVREYDRAPSAYQNIDLLVGYEELADLSAKAGIISREQAEKELKSRYISQAFADFIEGLLSEMKQRGYIEIVRNDKHHIVTVVPTIPKGLDYGRLLNRPWWYRKVLHPIRGDVRTIVIAIITAVIITLVTNLILRALGWL